jgi:hypothetical protein
LFLDKEKLELDFLGLSLNNFHQQAENFGAVEVYGVLAAHLLHYGIYFCHHKLKMVKVIRRRRRSHQTTMIHYHGR